MSKNYSLKITSIAEHKERIQRLESSSLEVLQTTKDLEKSRRLWVAAKKEIEKQVELFKEKEKMDLSVDASSNQRKKFSAYDLKIPRDKLKINRDDLK